jgi:hypothetical protein
MQCCHVIRPSHRRVHTVQWHIMGHVNYYVTQAEISLDPATLFPQLACQSVYGGSSCTVAFYAATEPLSLLPSVSFEALSFEQGHRLFLKAWFFCHTASSQHATMHASDRSCPCHPDRHMPCLASNCSHNRAAFVSLPRIVHYQIQASYFGTKLGFCSSSSQGSF